MKVNLKSISEWIIAGSFMFSLASLPFHTQSVWAHGGELGEEESPTSRAKQEETGPHGGPAVVFGNNHLEFTVEHESGEIVLFLLDKDLKAIPMPESYSGVVYIDMADGSKKTVTLERGTEGPVSHLEAETGIKEIGAFKVVVSLKTGERRENFRFNWTPAVHAHE
jgi:hypothetical protein